MPAVPAMPGAPAGSGLPTGATGTSGPTPRDIPSEIRVSKAAEEYLGGKFDTIKAAARSWSLPYTTLYGRPAVVPYLASPVGCSLVVVILARFGANEVGICK